MSFIEPVSATLGLACPPIAYKIDRFIYSYDVIRKASMYGPEWKKVGQPPTAKEEEENRKFWGFVGRTVLNAI